MGDFTTWPSGNTSAAAAAAGPGTEDWETAGCTSCCEGGASVTGLCIEDVDRLIRTFSSPSVISSSAMPDSSTRSINFFSFLRSILGLPGRLPFWCFFRRCHYYGAAFVQPTDASQP